MKFPGSCRASLVWIPEHNSDQQQVLAVNLGDVRELGEVDPVSVSKSFTLGQEKTLVHYGDEVGVCAMENQPERET